MAIPKAANNEHQPVEAAVTLALVGDFEGDTPATTVLFNESQSRIVISVAPENLQEAMSILRDGQIPFQQLGGVGGNKLRIRVGSEEFSWPIADLHDDWWNAIRRAVESDSAAEGIPSL